MSETNTQKIITDAILKSAIEKILTEISNYIYIEEPYTNLEIDSMFDASSQEIDYYSSLINDGMISENRLWSAKKISEELTKCILESNTYTDGLLSNLSSIELKYVTSLPIDNISSNTIYILKSSTETEHDTLNLYDGTRWTEIGKFEFDMSGYATTDVMNTELGKKANNNEVVKVNDILTDTTGAGNNNVLSASATVTELNKKIDKTGIIDNLTSTDIDKPLSAKQGKMLKDAQDSHICDTAVHMTQDEKNKLVTTDNITTTIDSSSTNDTVPTTKAVFNGIHETYNFIYRSTLTSLEEMNNAIETGYYRINLSTDPHKGVIPTYGVMSTYAGSADGFNGDNWFFQLYMSAEEGNKILYRKSINSSDANGWSDWEKLCTTSVNNVPLTSIKFINGVINPSDNYYIVRNGICFIHLNNGNYSLGETVNGLELAKGLPKPAAGQCSHTYLPWSTVDARKQVILFVNNNGQLLLHADVSANGAPLFTTFSYPVAES